MTISMSYVCDIKVWMVCFCWRDLYTCKSVSVGMIVLTSLKFIRFSDCPTVVHLKNTELRKSIKQDRVATIKFTCIVQ